MNQAALKVAVSLEFFQQFVPLCKISVGHVSVTSAFMYADLKFDFHTILIEETIDRIRILSIGLELASLQWKLMRGNIFKSICI